MKMRDSGIQKNHEKDKEVEVKDRHTKIKGTSFNSEINYHYNIWLKKVGGCLVLGFLKMVLFPENLVLWSMSSWAFVGGPGQNPATYIMLEVKPDPWISLARHSHLKGTLECRGCWSLYPTHPFCKATLQIPLTNTVPQKRGRQTDRLHAHGCCLSDTALPRGEGAEEQQPRCKGQKESFREAASNRKGCVGG